MKTTLTIQDIVNAMKLMNEDELMQINRYNVELIKAKRRAPNSERALANATAKAELKYGDEVEFNASRTNELIRGKIIKLGPKYAQMQTPEQVKEGLGRFWKVSPTMLRKVS